MFQTLRMAIVRLLGLDVPVVAGGLAFFGVLSVFPSIALALLAYGLLAVPGEASLLANAFKYLLPGAAHEIIVSEFRLLANWAAHHIGVGVGITIALVLWSAMAGWKALISGIRLVTGEQRRLTVIGYQFQSLMLSFLFIGAIAIAIMAFILLVRVVGYEAVMGDGAAGSSWSVLRAELIIWALASLGIYGALFAIYRVAISRSKASLADCSLGAMAGAFAWFCCVAVFDLYAETAAWHTIYGRLAGSVAILLWFYVSAYAALFGAAYAAALKRAREVVA